MEIACEAEGAKRKNEICELSSGMMEISQNTTCCVIFEIKLIDFRNMTLKC